MQSRGTSNVCPGHRYSSFIHALSGSPAVLISKQSFILKLAHALTLYGAPSHRLESQLSATAKVLSVPADVIHFPGVVLISFHDKVAKTSETHLVKASTRLQLGKLHAVHMVYRSVVHSQMGVAEGTEQLAKLIKSPAEYPLRLRCLFAFCCAFLICLSSFGGSVLDAGVAGCAGGVLAYLQLHAANKSTLYANVFELRNAFLVFVSSSTTTKLHGRSGFLTPL